MTYVDNCKKVVKAGEGQIASLEEKLKKVKEEQLKRQAELTKAEEVRSAIFSELSEQEKGCP
eukprot:13693020-Alexandrium_andersonii.AAC.1